MQIYITFFNGDGRGSTQPSLRDISFSEEVSEALYVVDSRQDCTRLSTVQRKNHLNKLNTCTMYSSFTGPKTFAYTTPIEVPYFVHSRNHSSNRPVALSCFLIILSQLATSPVSKVILSVTDELTEDSENRVIDSAYLRSFEAVHSPMQSQRISS